MAKTATKAQRTIPVRAFDDSRTHLAPPHRGLLRLGRLKTLCGRQAVTELPLFEAADPKDRCRTCFSKVDEHGYVKG